MNFWQLVHPDSRKNALRQASDPDQHVIRYELKILTKEGEIRWLDVTLTMFNHEGALASLITAFDISNRQQAEEEASHILSTDPLTGLSNYSRLIEVCDAEIKKAERSGQPCSLLLLTLDDGQMLDGRRGHPAADQELCRVARILLQCRASDTPARLKGREFAVVLPNTSAEGASLMAKRVAARIALDQKGPSLSSSLAIAVFPKDGKTTDKLLDAARARLRTTDVQTPVHDLNDQVAAQIPIT